MGTKLRILVADDLEECRWAIENLLGIEFEIVGTVSDGRKLIDAAVFFLPDVIVSDIFMPSLTGTQAMEELRRKGYEIPFVLVSAANSGIEAYIERGAMGFVYKGDMGHDLAEAVVSAACGQPFVSRNAHGQLSKYAQLNTSSSGRTLQ